MTIDIHPFVSGFLGPGQGQSCNTRYYSCLPVVKCFHGINLLKMQIGAGVLVTYHSENDHEIWT